MKNLASVFALLCLFLSTESMAQNDSTVIELTGYIDSYYASYSNKLATDEMQPYITVAPRDNQFGLNIAEIGATYNTGEVRGTFVIQYGDIATATWSERFRTIQEAWVGIEVIEGVWFDGGFFTTHIGAESFLPKNNYLSSTDIGTYNEPFYQSGARLSYERSEKFSAQFHLVSGYNLFLDNNDAKSVGMLFSYKFNEAVSMAYTNLYGRESLEDSVNQYRFYHNIYVTWDPNEKVSAIVGGDMSTQTNSKLDHPTKAAIMYNALAIARFRFTEKYSATSRLEFFNDEDGFISEVFTNQLGRQQGLKATAFTLGVEYAPTRQSYLRAETRWTWTDKNLLIFNKNGAASNKRTEFVINMGFYFNKRLR